RREGPRHVAPVRKLELVIGDPVAIRISGGRPAEDEVSAPGFRPSPWEDGRGWGFRRPGGGPFDPLVGDAHPSWARRLVRVDETVLADRHRRQRERGHLEVVGDAGALEPGARRQLAAEAVLVARGAAGGEEPVEVRGGFHPRPAVPRN